MLWNFSAAGLLLWLSRRYEKEIKPGTMFAGWLLLAGIGRSLIEFFRPDQPKIADLGISYSSCSLGVNGDHRGGAFDGAVQSDQTESC